MSRAENLFHIVKEGGKYLAFRRALNHYPSVAEYKKAKEEWLLQQEETARKKCKDLADVMDAYDLIFSLIGEVEKQSEEHLLFLVILSTLEYKEIKMREELRIRATEGIKLPRGRKWKALSAAKSALKHVIKPSYAENIGVC